MTFERVEILHHGPRTRVTRLFLDGYTIIRKEPLGPDAQSRLASETATLQRLRGVVGVVQLRDAPPYPGSLVLEDTRGQSLAELTRPLPIGQLIPLAIGVTRAVAEVHTSEVIHQDISPSNILRSEDGAALLIDFALATASGTLRAEPRAPAEIAGTLPYVAPEQTGRTRRSVDQRADLYALGATLYELATGEPPFGYGDPLRVIHDHLTRVPVSPRTVTPNLPAAFSDIIMHLLEKEPDSRYQTAEGVIYDLERVPTVGGRIRCGPARVGEHDVQPRLGPLSRLVGRTEELAALRAALDEASAARWRGVLISGAAGVGKTALIDQLRPEVTQRGGCYLAGKFDQYRRDYEFAATYQAFRVLVRHLLAEPEDELVTLRERILAAVGANAGLLAAVLPEFEALLGVPPDPGDPLTSQSRLPRASVSVLRVVASPRRPVVLVFDDLQWAGRRQLRIADLLLTEEPIDGLLLVGVLALEMARRLAAKPELFAAAAQQYVAAADRIDDPAERADAVDLLGRAADRAKLVGDFALVNTLVGAALRLIDRDETGTRVGLHLARHLALYSLGRLPEADDEYRTVESLPVSARQRAEATAVQVRSLTHRERFAEAAELGIASLREFGIDVPASDRLTVELDHQFQYLYRWLEDPDGSDLPGRREVSDPTLLATSGLLDATRRRPTSPPIWQCTAG